MSLTHTEILKIIETCKGHVKSLKIKNGLIEVEFLVPHQPKDETPLTHHRGQDIAATPIPEERNLMKDLVEPEDSEETSTQMLIDELNLTDPSKFEDLLASGEIVSAKEEYS